MPVPVTFWPLRSAVVLASPVMILLPEVRLPVIVAVGQLPAVIDGVPFALEPILTPALTMKVTVSPS